jgi:hypothetical protein
MNELEREKEMSKVAHLFFDLGQVSDKWIYYYSYNIKVTRKKEVITKLRHIIQILANESNSQQPLNEKEELLDIPAVMGILKVKSKSTLQNYKITGRLVPIILSSGIGKTKRGKTLYRRSDVDRFILERQ